jgi:hypothetical protein
MASYPTQFDQVILFFDLKGRCVKVVQNPVILVRFPSKYPTFIFGEVLLFYFITTPCWVPFLYPCLDLLKDVMV